MRDLINLVEAAQALLYHGTSVPALASIMHEGVIRQGDLDDGPGGVSLTREIGVAEAFAQDVDAREIDIMQTNGSDLSGIPGKPQGAILEFDWNGLKADHTLISHKWDGADSEHEERVKGDGFHIEKYLVGFIVADDDLQWWVAALEKEAQDWAPHDERESKLALVRAEMVKALVHHPLRRHA